MGVKQKEVLVAVGCAVIVVAGILVEGMLHVGNASLVALGCSIVFGVIATNVVRKKDTKTA